jgi:polyisoprenoid-binding protein YceI
LDGAGTQARFLIDEILRGSPNTVTGATSQVAGEIQIDLGSPVKAVVSPIQVEVGSLATDSNLRDRAIRNFILQTSQFPQVVFTPTSVEGLPEAAVVGQPLTFTVTGDLTIRDVSRPVTFSVTLTPESDAWLTGLASATILRSDFGLTIPSVPSVADVSQEVKLELEFVAVRSQ